MTEDIKTSLDQEIRSAVEVWLPYITINEVNVDFPSGNPNQVDVSVKYSTSLDPSINNEITLNMDTGGAEGTGS